MDVVDTKEAAVRAACIAALKTGQPMPKGVGGHEDVERRSTLAPPMQASRRTMGQSQSRQSRQGYAGKFEQ